MVFSPTFLRKNLVLWFFDSKFAMSKQMLNLKKLGL